MKEKYLYGPKKYYLLGKKKKQTNKQSIEYQFWEKVLVSTLKTGTLFLYFLSMCCKNNEYNSLEIRNLYRTYVSIFTNNYNTSIINETNNENR